MFRPDAGVTSPMVFPHRPRRYPHDMFPYSHMVERRRSPRVNCCLSCSCRSGLTAICSTPQFQGVIPGGQSFDIPVGATTARTGEGIGFNWTPSVRISTTLLLVGGDDRGPGIAGSNPYTLQQGSSQSCLNSTSPSSTPGSPAGGSYPTSTDGSGVNTGNGGG